MGCVVFEIALQGWKWKIEKVVKCETACSVQNEGEIGLCALGGASCAGGTVEEQVLLCC